MLQPDLTPSLVDDLEQRWSTWGTSLLDAWLTPGTRRGFAFSSVLFFFLQQRQCRRRSAGVSHHSRLCLGFSESAKETHNNNNDNNISLFY